MEYDVAIVGAGCFGATLAEQLSVAGKKVLVIDKRRHIGGLAHASRVHGITVHNYGAHIFHTNNEAIWKYVNRITPFTLYRHQVYTSYQNKIYPFPPNLLTLSMFFGRSFTPDEAAEFFAQQNKKVSNARNAEEKGIQLVGEELYYAFYHDYTTKHWGRSPSELPAQIISRLPVRSNFRSDYFGDKYQGLPAHVSGYTEMFNVMLQDVDVWLEYDFFANREKIESLCDILVFSGQVDKFFDFQYGKLNWRSLKFETEMVETADYQGTSVINFPEITVPFNRIVEFKHLHPNDSNKTVLMRDFPCDNPNEPIYPVRTENDKLVYKKYMELARRAESNNVYIGGRLGSYQYYNMDQVIASAIQLAKKIS